VLKDRSLVAGRGSLAEVLPDSFKNLFNHAAAAFEECGFIGWTGTSGQSYDWRICRAPAVPGEIVNQDLHRTMDERVDRFGPIADELPLRRSVTDWIGEAEDPSWKGKGRNRDVTAG